MEGGWGGCRWTVVGAVLLDAQLEDDCGSLRAQIRARVRVTLTPILTVSIAPTPTLTLTLTLTPTPTPNPNPTSTVTVTLTPTLTITLDLTLSLTLTVAQLEQSGDEASQAEGAYQQLESKHLHMLSLQVKARAQG